MPRQRISERTSLLSLVGRIVPLILAIALIWYGAMLILLAVKVSPTTVNSISGYRTAWRWLAGLDTSTVSGGVTRGIIAACGVAAFLFFGFLAYKQLPRPYLTRRELRLSSDSQGAVTVEPRAVERLAEVAAESHHAVSSARGRHSVDGLFVDLSVRRPDNLADTMHDAQRRVADALERHQLPNMPINITLVGFEGRRRELQ
jgi:hypothetical protein